jgi:hypothetical protein
MGGILYTLHFMNYIQDWTHNECYLRYALFALLSLDSRPRIPKAAQWGTTLPLHDSCVYCNLDLPHLGCTA